MVRYYKGFTPSPVSSGQSSTATTNEPFEGALRQINGNNQRWDGDTWQTITIGGSSSDSTVYTEEIDNAKLAGSTTYTVSHGLGSTVLDVEFDDGPGKIDLDWEFIDSNNIRVDFSGLTPLTTIYSVRAEKN